MFNKSELPLTLSKEDYLSDNKKDIKIELIATILGGIIACAIFVKIIIDKSGSNVPTVPLGSIQMPVTILVVALFGFFILLAVLNSLRNRKKYKSPDWIEDVFTNGIEKEGIYVDYDTGVST